MTGDKGRVISHTSSIPHLLIRVQQVICFVAYDACSSKALLWVGGGGVEKERIILKYW